MSCSCRFFSVRTPHTLCFSYVKIPNSHIFPSPSARWFFRCFLLPSFLPAQLLASAAAQLEGYTYIIDPSKPSGEGGDLEVDCLERVQPGESCYLMSGDHMHDGLTQRHGEEGNRILITGDTDACIKGSNTQDRALQIAHNWYTIENICFDGNHGDEHVATAVYVLGADRASTSDESHGIKSAVTGLQMFNLEIKNFDEECIHLRYFVTFTEIRGCSITDCGKHSFSDGGGGAVGEGVYVGTALDQVDDNKVRLSIERAAAD